MKKSLFLFLLTAMQAGAFAQTTYTVKSGDTLYGLAKTHKVDVKKLISANPTIKDGKLKIGQVITIPGKASAKKTVSAAPEELGFIIIQPKQTLYGLSKQYKISQDEIKKLNPNLEMKIGEEVKLPVRLIKKYADANAYVRTAPVTPKAEPVKEINTENGFTLYKVEEGDTVFGIVNKFDVDLQELIAMNPEIENGLKAGDTIKVKALSSAFAKNKSSVFEINLMLPFGFNTKDAQYRKIATEFLKGAKLAIERNVAGGLPIHLRIIDAGSESAFKNSLAQINRENTNMIVGPFFKSNLLEVMDYVKAYDIPVVAPFANSSDLFKYNNLIIVETPEEVYDAALAEEVKKIYQGQKITLLADESKEKTSGIIAEIKKKLNTSDVDIEVVSSASQINPAKNMMTGAIAPQIIINTSNKENTTEQFAARLMLLAEENPNIRSFSLGYAPVFDKKIDELGKASLVYFLDRKINTEGSFEKEILTAYKAKYCETPSKYSVIGFDVLNDVLSRSGLRTNTMKNLKREQTQLATKFQYEKAEGGNAYINTGFRIVRLLP